MNWTFITIETIIMTIAFTAMILIPLVKNCTPMSITTLFIVTEGEAKILLGDEEVIIHKDEAFLVEGRIPHSCWNNIEGVTKMIGITVV